MKIISWKGSRWKPSETVAICVPFSRFKLSDPTLFIDSYLDSYLDFDVEGTEVTDDELMENLLVVDSFLLPHVESVEFSLIGS